MDYFADADFFVVTGIALAGLWLLIAAIRTRPANRTDQHAEAVQRRAELDRARGGSFQV